MMQKMVVTLGLLSVRSSLCLYLPIGRCEPLHRTKDWWMVGDNQISFGVDTFGHNVGRQVVAKRHLSNDFLLGRLDLKHKADL